MKRYPITIRREASYVEELDAVIVAGSKSEAERMASQVGDGEALDWPHLDRYNVVSRTDVRHSLIEIEHGRT